ncbi:MAG: phosphoglycerate dehydrogenase [Anaerolineaceae bacterium]|nr:phosphoglycerate dehydrogenase [Anaerolineaceae bacterium]
MKPLNQCKILVTPTSFGSQDETLKTELESQVKEVVYNNTGKPIPSIKLQEMLLDVDGMIAGLDEIDSAALSVASHLKVVARYGVGYNNVDLDAARENKIIVTNTPGANAKSVAELTIAMILNLCRPVIQANNQTKAGEWPRFKGLSLEGKTVGLLGLGAIGKETARRLAGFDCKILAYDIYQDKVFAQTNNITFLPLDEILEKADIISLHLPGIPETRGMVNSEFLSKMKDGAFLINTARGDLINEKALFDVLESGKLRGAALDAYQQEPPSKDNPLLKMPQVIATPHMGAHADSATNAMGRLALDECLAVLEGRNPKYKVN